MVLPTRTHHYRNSVALLLQLTLSASNTLLSLVLRFVCKNNGVLFENQLLQIGIKSEYRQNLGKSQHLQNANCIIWMCKSSDFWTMSLTLLCFNLRLQEILVSMYMRLQFLLILLLTILLCLIYISSKWCYTDVQVVCLLPLHTGRMYLFYGNKTSVQFVTFTTTVSCPGELQSHILHTCTCKHLFIQGSTLGHSKPWLTKFFFAFTVLLLIIYLGLHFNSGSF